MKHPGVIAYVIAILLVTTAASQDVAVPIDIQYALFMKILSYDRALLSNNDESITIGIAYQGRFPASKNVKDEFVETILKNPDNLIQGRTIEYIEIDIMNEDIQAIIASSRIDVLYLTPVRAYTIDILVELCRTYDVLSLSSVPEYCISGLSVSISQRAGKPEIIVNLDAARQEGSRFSSQLLKLATIL